MAKDEEKEIRLIKEKLDYYMMEADDKDFDTEDVQKLLNEDGTLTENTGAFATAYEKEAKENHRLHVFVAEVDGETKYVFPVYGAGLWGAIWGYVALNSDKDTVYGVYFSHASETPGLGAEIATPQFQGEFPGKKTLENGEIALGVVKNGKVEKPDYQVDGISGGTITSVGVDAMLKTCLNSYKNFFPFMYFLEGLIQCLRKIDVLFIVTFHDFAHCRFYLLNDVCRLMLSTLVTNWI